MFGLGGATVLRMDIYMRARTQFGHFEVAHDQGQTPLHLVLFAIGGGQCAPARQAAVLGAITCSIVSVGGRRTWV